MFDIMFSLHMLFAIFAIGPLVHAAAVASRGIRRGDGAATAESARVLRIYSYASITVAVFGMGLVSAKEDGEKVASFGETWVWLSTLLWLVAVALVLAVLVPTLNKATDLIGRQESVVSLTARVAAAGGIVATIFAAIVFLMVYKPGH